MSSNAISNEISDRSTPKWLFIAIIFVGFVFRMIWLLKTHGLGPTSPSEAFNVARSIFMSGSVSDAFKPGQGPTAHLMPIPAAIAAGIYRLFGFDTAPANLVLTIWSLLLVFTSFWYANLTFEKLGLPSLARLLALAILCIAPLNFSLEVLQFRVWDGSLSVALASVTLYCIVSWDGKKTGYKRIFLLAIMMALTFFVQPNVGLGTAAAGLLFAWRNIPAHAWVGSAIALLVAGLIVFGPWVARNQIVMGSPILLRDNLGLEIALAFHENAAKSNSQRDAFLTRINQIHPFSNGPGYDALKQAGGELAYSKLLKSETISWSVQHPLSTLRLYLMHVGEMIFPPGWLWSIGVNAGTGTLYKEVAFYFISIAAILGIGLSLALKPSNIMYPVLCITITTLSYGMVQPILRYHYFIYTLSVYFAVYALWRIFQMHLSDLFISKSPSSN